ncbi:SprB repeat-containing protein, partial [Aureispira sp. CCB-QB1]|uniref:SprB repeat-containing protein n=1 Tax=Aureispira sp. CCB-QB1 TaxID=1313421 RepID=UPI0012DF4CBD
MRYLSMVLTSSLLVGLLGVLGYTNQIQTLAAQPHPTANILNTPISFTVSSTSVNCHGASDGSATINVSGGVGGFSYVWNSNTQTTATATGLSAGLHCV